MLVLLIVGAVLLIVGYLVPMPPPLHTLVLIAGAICAVVGGIYLVVDLIGYAGHDTRVNP